MKLQESDFSSVGRMVLRLFFILTLFSKSGISFTASASYHNSNGAAVNKSSRRFIPRGGSSSSSSSRSSSASSLEAPTNENEAEDAITTTTTSTKKSNGPLRVLFLSSDTGGGHRASAESLAKQFELQFPGTTYDVCDIWSLDGCLPYRRIVPTYTHFSAHPWQWKLFFHGSNLRFVEAWSDFHSKFVCERKIRRRIASYDPDVVVSVHPTMNLCPAYSLGKLSTLVQRHIPIYTVVTDLGSAHCMWFKKQVDTLFVPSERLHRMAVTRGKVPEEKLDLIGLPIRNDFGVEAKKLQTRSSPEGRAYQAQIRTALGLDPDRAMVLVMGGGEGMGGLSAIVDGLYASLVHNGLDVTICVVCAKNKKLKQDLADRDWEHVVVPAETKKRRKMEQRQSRRSGSRLRRLLPGGGRLRRLWPGRNKDDLATETDGTFRRKGKVQVIGLGYVTKMAEYMVAADVLVSKAGPGTIAEAASLGLPCMLTSFLPGQEAGNVDFVVEKGFGTYCHHPTEIGQQVSNWLNDPILRSKMNTQALASSNADAAAQIIQKIGTAANAYKNVSIENSVDGKTRLSTNELKNKKGKLLFKPYK